MAQLGDLLARIALGETLGRGEAETLRLEFNNMQSLTAIARKWAAPSGDLDLSFLPISTIYSKVLSVDAASVTVPIGSTYRHLILFGNGRTTTAAVPDHILIQLNGDTAANYAWDSIASQDGVHASDTNAAATYFLFAGVPGASASANYSGGGVMFIGNVASSLYKNAVCISSGQNYDAGPPVVQNSGLRLYGGQWRSTAKITSVKFLTLSGDNILAGASFAVVGVV